MNILISALAFLVAIGILIAVHEFGHFSVARMLGVRVLRFSIGFGRPLWRYCAGPGKTEYWLSAIPLGGYVKLLDEREAPVPEAELAQTFNRQPILSRIAILAAGPGFNFAFAILAYWIMFMIGVGGLRPVVGDILADSPAAQAGLEGGDEIIAVGGSTVPTWETAVVSMLDGMLGEERIDLRVRGADGSERSLSLDVRGRSAELTEPGALFTGLGFSPWTPLLPAVLDEVLPGGSAARSGLLTGDKLLSVEGEPLESWPQWVEYVRAHPDETVLVTLRRDDAVMELALEIGYVETEGGVLVGRIGASPRVPTGLYEDMRAVERFSAWPALTAATIRTWEMSSLTLRMIGRMVTGHVSVKNISGPINIAQYAGYSASIGLSPFLGFLAVVSLSLGILNLLPVPMLDGGQIFFQSIEWVKGSPLSERSQLIGQQIGIFLLLALMSFAFYNDIARLLG